MFFRGLFKFFFMGIIEGICRFDYWRLDRDWEGGGFIEISV